MTQEKVGRHREPQVSTDRSSHLICTQPGLRMNDHGWYHFSTTSTQEHNVSSHKCSTCSLYNHKHRTHTAAMFTR